MGNEALYLKVAFYLCDKIVKNELHHHDKVDLTNYAFEVGVSKHVVSKSFEYLNDQQVLTFNEGEFFVSSNADVLALQLRKKAFLNTELNSVFEMLSLYKISISDIESAYIKYQDNSL